MICRELNLFIRVSDTGKISTTVFEPESGEQTTLYNEYSPDEHPEFNKSIGDEVYSWIQLWADENDENKRGIEFQ